MVLSPAALLELPTWADIQDFHVQLAPPSGRNPLVTMFRGTLWLAVFRITLPCVYFAVGVDAIAEVYRIWSLGRLLNSKVIICVCSLEAFSMLMIGIALAGGLYGPNDLPIYVLNISFTQFQGLGAFTSITLALQLREQITFNYLYAQQDIFIAYRWKLTWLFVLCVSMDIFAIFVTVRMSVFAGGLVGYSIYLFLDVFYTALNSIAACCEFYSARY